MGLSRDLNFTSAALTRERHYAYMSVLLVLASANSRDSIPAPLAFLPPLRRAPSRTRVPRVYLPAPRSAGLRPPASREGVITFRRGRFQTPSRRHFRMSVCFLRDRQAERGNARNESKELIRPRYSRRVATCEIARLPFYRRC